MEDSNRGRIKMREIKESYLECCYKDEELVGNYTPEFDLFNSKNLIKKIELAVKQQEKENKPID